MKRKVRLSFSGQRLRVGASALFSRSWSCSMVVVRQCRPVFLQHIRATLLHVYAIILSIHGIMQCIHAIIQFIFLADTDLEPEVEPDLEVPFLRQV